MLDHPYHTVLRVISSVLHNLQTMHVELGDSCKKLQKEMARRDKAEQIVSTLLPSERDIARRVVQAIFHDDDPELYSTQRQRSFTVRMPLCLRGTTKRSYSPLQSL